MSPVTSTILALISCAAFAACAAPSAAPRPNRPKQANTRAAVQQRVQQFSRDIAQREHEQKTAKDRRSIARLRHAWYDQLQAQRKAEAVFAQQGFTFDTEYYQLRHELLDAQFAQLNQLRQLSREEWPH